MGLPRAVETAEAESFLREKLRPLWDLCNDGVFKQVFQSTINEALRVLDEPPALPAERLARLIKRKLDRLLIALKNRPINQVVDQLELTLTSLGISGPAEATAQNQPPPPPPVLEVPNEDEPMPDGLLKTWYDKFKELGREAEESSPGGFHGQLLHKS